MLLKENQFLQNGNKIKYLSFLCGPVPVHGPEAADHCHRICGRRNRARQAVKGVDDAITYMQQCGLDSVGRTVTLLLTPADAMPNPGSVLKWSRQHRA